MFQTLIYPSSGPCDYSVELSHWPYCSWFDVCWSFGVVGLEWYLCCRLKLQLDVTCYFISLLMCSKFFFFGPMPPHVLMDFVVLPPGHGRSVTNFWGWDAHEAQLHCPDDVSGDIGGCGARRALKPKFYQPTQTMVTAGILPFRENSHGTAGNRTRDCTISNQRLWPLDHEAGQCAQHVSDINISIIRSLRLFCWITILVILKWYPCCRMKLQLDVTCYFISLLMCSTCFGH